jgi:hypothetical protein
MPLPDRIASEAELEDLLAEPSEEDIAAVARLDPDIMILGAGGKMGPSLARRVKRAAARAGTGSRVLAVSRFSSTAARASLEADGVPTLACDFLSAPAILGLPKFPNVLYLAGRKFGTSDRTDVTWATNTVVPARVAEQFVDSRMVVFSTGNVYPLVPVTGPAPTEADPPAPVGEYAQSCLGRERVVEYVSREAGLRALMFRLNYAVDLRYGTLVDIAHKVFAGEPIDLSVASFNAIWQGDANSYALRSLELCASPPAVLNVTGGERISTRECAEWFGTFFAKAPRFVNQEGTMALLSDSTLCRTLLGAPDVPLQVLFRWVGHWVRDGGSTLNKPTHFEVTDGRF